MPPKKKQKPPVNPALAALAASILGTSSVESSAPSITPSLIVPSDYKTNAAFMQLDLMCAFRAIVSGFQKALPDDLIFDVERVNGMIMRQMTLAHCGFVRIQFLPCAFSTFHVSKDIPLMLQKKALVGDVSGERDDDTMQLSLPETSEECLIVIGGLDGRKLRHIKLKLLSVDDSRPAAAPEVDWSVIFMMEVKTLENAVARTAKGIDQVMFRFSTDEFVIECKRDQGDKNQVLKVTDQRRKPGSVAITSAEAGAIALNTGMAVIVSFQQAIKVKLSYKYLSEIIGSGLSPFVEVSLNKDIIRLRYDIAAEKCTYTNVEGRAVVGELEFMLATHILEGEAETVRAEAEEVADLNALREEEEPVRAETVEEAWDAGGGEEVEAEATTTFSAFDGTTEDELML